ncbi:MAG: fumarate hydratase C-terminal domain-containing protein [Lentisphaeria bacterium]|nr:fumarate hydratase C-terminal domain-containing protein [Lentisphaeria bacterium]
MAEIRDIKLPMTEEDVKSLKLGEMITVSGLLFTGRSRLHIRAIEDNIYPPIDYEKINCFFHVGPVMRQEEDGEWKVVSCEPTSSIRFERYGADVVRKFKLRTLIGKTTMGPATAQALKEVGGIYLSKIGLSGNALKDQVKKVHDVYFLDELGKTECTWIYEVDHFGPFFVAMDSEGNNYFEDLAKEAESKMPEIEKDLGIPAGYDYTEVNAK